MPVAKSVQCWATIMMYEHKPLWAANYTDTAVDTMVDIKEKRCARTKNHEGPHMVRVQNKPYLF